MNIEWTPAIPKGFKRFESKRCGYKFIKKIPSPITKCPKCEEVLIAKGFEGRKLDYYSQMKLSWLKNPKLWADNIRHRQIVNKEKGASGKVYLTDSSGSRIGEMPTIVEWN